MLMRTETTATPPLQHPAWLEKRDLAPSLDKVRSFTMVPAESLIDLARLVRTVLMYNIPGDFVECGVWRGGASFLVADLLRQAGVQDRKVWLFDSFEGLPPPQEIDGPEALAYARSTDDPWYHDSCRASLENVQQTATELGLSSYAQFIKGWFDQTLPVNRQRIGPIAVLRIDGDWYSSVHCCLDQLYDQVVDGGFVVLDDYYAYDGCAIAVHEFLGERHLAHRIENVVGAEDYQSALFRKGKPTWKWTQRVYLALQDIAALIPPDETLILVDEGQWDLAERRCIPFLERDGAYWGAPEDDETAIGELERLRRAGAGFLAFGWPAFWWLDYYAVFQRHLRQRFRCVLQNDRLVVFDLRT
jgi:O-methyltransferase